MVVPGSPEGSGLQIYWLGGGGPIGRSQSGGRSNVFGMVWIGLASSSRNNVFGLVWFGSVGLALLVCLAAKLWLCWFGVGLFGLVLVRQPKRCRCSGGVRQ